MSDDPVTMCALTKLIQALMEDVAKTHHIKDIKDELTTQKASIQKVEARVEGVESKFASFEERLRRVEAGHAAQSATTGRRSTGSASSSSAAAREPQFSASEWISRVMHWRDWAPFGCPPGQKLDRAEAKSLQEQIEQQLDEETRPRLRWLQPFVQNHAVSAQVLGARFGDTKSIADESTIAITKCPIFARVLPIRVGVETSPTRGEALRDFFEARDLLRQMNAVYNFTICSRSLEVGCDAGVQRIGWWQLDEALWRWSPWAAPIAKVKLPMEFSNGEEGATTPINKESGETEDQHGKREEMDAGAEDEVKDGEDQQDKTDKENVDPRGQKQPLPESDETEVGTGKKKQRVLNACSSADLVLTGVAQIRSSRT